MAGYEVETVSIDGRVTALGSAGKFTLVVDRPEEGGGGGQGFNGGQLLNLAVAGCISNDLFREAAGRGLTLTRVRVTVDSDYRGTPAVSTPIEYRVEVIGEGSEDDLRALVAYVDEIAEIPNSLRNGTPVSLASSEVRGTG